MKTFITTTESLASIFEKGLSADVGLMYIFVKEKDAIPISVCGQIFLACNQGLQVMTIHYASKEELLFRLGCMLEKEIDYIISDGIFQIPDYIKNEYKIVVDGAKQAKPKRTSSSRRKKNSHPETPIVDESTVATVATTSYTYTPDVPKDFMPEPVDNTATEVVSNEEISGDEETTVQDEVSETAVPTEDVTISDEVVAMETVKSSTHHHSEEAISEFLKRSGVRAADIAGYTGSDADLGDELLDILVADTDKIRIKNEMTIRYGSMDAECLMKWIGPNIVKLHEIAITES